MLVKPLEEIQDRIRKITFLEQFDLIVAVARGGIIPAVLLQARFGCDLEWLWLHFRDDKQNPEVPQPILTRPLSFDPKGRTILLVDDRSRTGSTLRVAKDILISATLVKTCVVNGAADYPLFDEECFYFPWRMDIEP